MDPIPYLHELLNGSALVEVPLEVPQRNPELEKRCEKLRALALDRSYRKMVKDVDAG
eukprot:UC1_evm1s821